jgi:hypothetical protein
MRNETGKFSFKVPEGHEEAGKKIEKPFDYEVCESEPEALTVIEKKKWNITDMVNEALKANARASAYQAATLPYKPSEVSKEDIVERMVRDYIRLGIPEDAARSQVLALTNSQG